MNKGVRNLRKGFRLLGTSARINHENLNVHMFTEDVYQSILPIGGKSTKHPKFKIHVHGKQNDIEKTIRLFSIETRYHNNDVTVGICDLVESIASTLCYHGRAYYNIISENDEYFITPFINEKVLRITPNYFLIVGSPNKNFLKEERIHIRYRTDIWKVEIPRLGGPKGFKRTLLRVQKYDPLMSGFWMKNLTSMDKRLDINLSEYIKKHEIYLQKVTRKWGWDKRDTTTNNKTEFYLVYQQVAMAISRAILREHIINELNSLVAHYNWDCKISITGIPSSIDLLSLKEKLIRGEVSFEQVFNDISLL